MAKIKLKYLFFNAECFYEIGKNSVINFNTIFRSGQFCQQDLSYVSVGATNFTLAVELYLKALNLLCSDKQMYRHELVKLLNNLPEDTRIKLNNGYLTELANRTIGLGDFRTNSGSKSSSDLRKERTDLMLLVSSHDIAFIKWRYMHEESKDELAADFDGLECFILAMRKIIVEISQEKGFDLIEKKYNKS